MQDRVPNEYDPLKLLLSPGTIQEYQIPVIRSTLLSISRDAVSEQFREGQPALDASIVLTLAATGSIEGEQFVSFYRENVGILRLLFAALRSLSVGRPLQAVGRVFQDPVAVIRFYKAFTHLVRNRAVIGAIKAAAFFTQLISNVIVGTDRKLWPAVVTPECIEAAFQFILAAGAGEAARGAMEGVLGGLVSIAVGSHDDGAFFASLFSFDQGIQFSVMSLFADAATKSDGVLGWMVGLLRALSSLGEAASRAILGPLCAMDTIQEGCLDQHPLHRIAVILQALYENKSTVQHAASREEAERMGSASVRPSRGPSAGILIVLTDIIMDLTRMTCTLNEIDGQERRPLPDSVATRPVRTCPAPGPGDIRFDLGPDRLFRKNADNESGYLMDEDADALSAITDAASQASTWGLPPLIDCTREGLIKERSELLKDDSESVSRYRETFEEIWAGFTRAPLVHFALAAELLRAITALAAAARVEARKIACERGALPKLSALLWRETLSTMYVRCSQDGKTVLLRIPGWPACTGVVLTQGETSVLPMTIARAAELISTHAEDAPTDTELITFIGYRQELIAAITSLVAMNPWGSDAARCLGVCTLALTHVADDYAAPCLKERALLLIRMLTMSCLPCQNEFALLTNQEVSDRSSRQRNPESTE